MSYFVLDTKQMEKLVSSVERFADGREGERIINDYLHGEGGGVIKNEIQSILPVSGRKAWQGKAPAASSSRPFLKDNEPLGVRIHTKGTYHYLYFPDDGSNTIHHVGNQHFMFDGASRKAEEIGNTLIEKIVKRLEES